MKSVSVLLAEPINCFLLLAGAISEVDKISKWCPKGPNLHGGVLLIQELKLKKKIFKLPLEELKPFYKKECFALCVLKL